MLHYPQFTTQTCRLWSAGSRLRGGRKILCRFMSDQPVGKPAKPPAVPRPSSSVLLISPLNQILLLHRVSTSSSFASAHVFPGGVVSPEHDGDLPHVDDPGRHQDGPAYRAAAIRETFEECGILLALDKGTKKLFNGISNDEREEGRRAVHQGKILFQDLMDKWGCVADTKALIPFTRWVTPSNVPKRFSTQMYIYFLPLSSTVLSASTPSSTISETSDASDEHGVEIIIPNPTHDGGIEHTAARFLPPNQWISLARQNRIILFPPQFFLTHLLAPYLSANVTTSTSPLPSLEALAAERSALHSFLITPRIYNGNLEVDFAEACISPVVLGRSEYGGESLNGKKEGLGRNTIVLALDRSGTEVEQLGGGRRGISEWVVTTKFKKEGPRDVDVKRREEIFGQWRAKGEEKL